MVARLESQRRLMLEHRLQDYFARLALSYPIRILDSELAQVTLDALQGRAAALMANHGAIAHAPDLATAVEFSLLLEWACGVYWHARALGNPRTIDAAQGQAVVEAAVARGYGSTRGRRR